MNLSRYGNLFIVLVFVAVLATLAHRERAHPFVNLFANRAAVGELSSLSGALAQAGIDHRIDPESNSLKVHTEDKRLAKLTLIRAGLPKSTGTLTEDPGLNDIEFWEKAAEVKETTSQELVAVLRGLEKVDMAIVKLAKPTELHPTPAGKTTARVFLKFVDGAELEQSRILAIVNTVALSYTELEPENVRVLDSKGRNLMALFRARSRMRQ